MRNNALKYAMLSGVAPMMLLGVCAHAQDAAQADAHGDGHADKAQPRIGPQDIIVTANRQEQNIEKVSVAVKVINGDELRGQALVNVQQIFASMPGVQVTAQPAGFNIDIRGQAADQPASAGQGSVAMEFDGIYNIQSYATTVGFFDVGRIEVLPGPQSTRYGPNAKGGVVNVLSRDPMLGKHDGSATLTIGNYGLVRGEAAQDIPITDTLSLRVSGAGIGRGSYFTPATGNAIAQSGRAKLLFQPNDKLTIRAEYQYDHVGGTGSGSEAGAPFYAAFVNPYPGDSINKAKNPWALGDYSNDPATAPYNTHSNVSQHTLWGSVGYQLLDHAAVDVTQSYITENGSQYDCEPNTFARVGGAHTCYQEHPFGPFYSYSTEVRLHSTAGSKVLWNLGFYHWNYLSRSWSTNVPPSITNPGPAYANLSATHTNAAFGDITYPLTDRLRVIGGVRQSWDGRLYSPGNTDTTIYKASFKNTDYRVGQEFDIAPTSMEYFTVSTGYAPGSVSTGTNNKGVYGLVVNPNETLTDFELGVKNQFFDRRVTFNVDAFRYVQKNYSFNNNYAGFTLPDGTNCVYGSRTNPATCNIPHAIANAKTLGLEVQFIARVTPDDRLSINGTWLHARYDKVQGNCNTTALPANLTGGCYLGTNNADTGALIWTNIGGATQDHAPAFASNIDYTHTFRFKSGARLEMGGNIFHSSSYWEMPIYDSQNWFQPGYWQYNANVSFHPAGDRWSLVGYIRNISNYAVKMSGQPATTIGDPRTFGGTLNIKW